MKFDVKFGEVQELKGEDGISPTVAVAEIEGGHRVTITDKDGAKSFDVMDGKDGTGSGGGSAAAVLYTEQDLTEEQQEQARNNIGAASAYNGGGKSSELDAFIANTDIDHAYDEATGAYYTVIRVYRDKLDGTKQYPFVYAPNGANAGNKSTYDMAITDGWMLAINGGLFDTDTRKPDGIVIQDGTVVQNSPTAVADHVECKPLTIDESGNLGYAEHDAEADTLVENGIVSAVCGFMPIIVDYEAVPETEWNAIGNYTQNAPRQVIGQWGNGDYAIITCEGRGVHNSDGWTIAEAQTICKKLGLKFAYNLDGGGSTETMVGKKHINTIYENATGRIVPTFIVFNGTSNFAHTTDDTHTHNYVDGVCSGCGIIDPSCYEILMNHATTYYGYDGLGGTLSINTGNRITALSSQYSPKLPYRNAMNDALTGEISEYAPIKLPKGAISIEVACPGLVPALALWTTNGEIWEKTVDSGWLTTDGCKYVLPTNAEYTHFMVNFKNPNGSITQDTDVSRISIVVNSTTGSQGSGNELPNGYTRLDYIKVDGRQYVNSGIPATTDVSVEYAFAPDQDNGIESSGHILSAAKAFVPFLRYRKDGSRGLIAVRFGEEQLFAYAFEDNVKYTIKAYLDGTDNIFVNDSLVGTCSKGNTELSESDMLYLFAYGANLNATYYRASGKFYYMKLYDANGELIRHFVPCTNADSVVGLFDVANGVFYDSDTDVAFIRP